MPRFSHVSAVHNEERWLPAMIESWQHEADAVESSAELIIVNDHSEDATEAVAQTYADRDPRIRVFSSQDQGRRRGKVAAFNLGVENSAGEFIGLIAGDDLMAPGALGVWSCAVADFSSQDRVVAFARLQTMSDDPKADGLVIPRRPVGNRSGGTSLFSRALAEFVFPIPDELPSEDIWTSHLLTAKADVIIDLAEIVLLYRIHAGNSNPRARGFAEMSVAMNKRARAYDLMLDDSQLELTDEQRETLAARVALKRWRVTGNVRAILGETRTTWSQRLRVATMANPSLWRLRQKFFRHFSGW